MRTCPQATKTFYNSKDEMLQLWCHETVRIIADRMWDPTDKDWLKRQLDDKLGGVLSSSFNSLFEQYNDEIPPFVTFMRQVRAAWHVPGAGAGAGGGAEAGQGQRRRWRRDDKIGGGEGLL